MVSGKKTKICKEVFISFFLCVFHSLELYLCDSGGQYRSGTTDVTRTMHFGSPTQHQRDSFTRVLKGGKKIEQTELKFFFTFFFFLLL